MRVFFNFFLKTLAFFIATTFFVIILSLIIIFPFSDIDKIKNKKFTFKEGDGDSENKIILIELRGPILNEPLDLLEFSLVDSIEAIYVTEFIKDLKEIEIEKPVGILISINSPGGSVSATYRLYQAIENFKINNQTKIFLHTNEILASGGYWAALASDKIYASYGAMIGSIGVRGPDWLYFDNPISISSGIFGQEIQTKGGIKKFNTIAGRSKDLFDSFRMPTKDERRALQDIVNGVYVDFVNIVSKKRSIENHFITEDLGALIFDAKKAKENYLIDDIKNLKEVKNHLIQELRLKNFKIIQKEVKKGLLKEIIQSSLIMRYDINNLRRNRICNSINSYINLLLTDEYYKKYC